MSLIFYAAGNVDDTTEEAIFVTEELAMTQALLEFEAVSEEDSANFVTTFEPATEDQLRRSIESDKPWRDVKFLMFRDRPDLSEYWYVRPISVFQSNDEVYPEESK